MAKTVKEILNSWTLDGCDKDWYAIDSYNSRTNEQHRLFVGSYEQVSEMLKEYYVSPHEWQTNIWYQCFMIDTVDAYRYFLDCWAQTL